ncbi:MAG: hypothetical protein JWN48_390 [Myxococcaceae bacterium]|nr:hypothetical protein [Myxococcaceae bacterium]
MRAPQRHVRVLCGLSLIAALHAGCSDDNDEPKDAGGGTRSDAGADASVRSDGGMDASSVVVTDASSDAATAVLSEAQVVGVAAAINAGEIGAAMVAQGKATTAAARDYAAMMIEMHTAAQQRQTALGITPTTSPQQTTVMTMASQTLQTLQSTPAGPGFDVTYLQSQVTMHNSALSLIDSVLLPSASTPALRAELTRARGEVVMHLTLAQGLLSADGGVVGGDAGARSTTDGGLDSGT